MFNFTSILQNITSNKLITNISDKYKKMKQQIKQKFQIVQVIPSIYHIHFPQTSNIPQLISHMAGCKYLLMNIGQYPYEVQFVQKLKQKNINGKLKHIYFQYYSSIPFDHLIQNMKEVKQFIDKNKDNKVYIICQQNSIRSAVFLSCYIYMNKLMGIEDISQAILYVNQKLNLTLQENKDSSLYKNHHTLFKNIIHYTSNPEFINKNQLSLVKISIKNAPKIKIQNISSKFNIIDLLQIKLAIQLRCGSKIIHKSISNQPIIEGQSICIDFIKLNKKIDISDEFLLIIKYIYDKKLFNVMRIQLNTNFIFNQFIRVHQHDIDLSRYCQFDKKDVIFVDFQFHNKSQVSQLAILAVKNKEKEKEKMKKEEKIKKEDILNFQNKKDNHSYNLLQGQGVNDQTEQNKQKDTINQMHFDWFNQNIEFDDNDISNKIEQVMKTLNLKQQQRANDLKQQQQEGDEDLDDYLKNLQSQA